MHTNIFKRLKKFIKLLDETIEGESTKLLKSESKNNEEIELKKSGEKNKILLDFNKAFIKKLKQVRDAYLPIWRDANALFFLRNPMTTIVVLLVVGYLFDRQFMGRATRVMLPVRPIVQLPIVPSKIDLVTAPLSLLQYP